MTAAGYSPDFSERLAKVIDSAGSLVKAGELAGVSDEQVARWRDGLSKPNFFGLGSLAIATGYSLDWILTGEGMQGAKWRDLRAEVERLAQQVEPEARDGAELPGDFRLIPRLDVQASAGPGALVDSETSMEMLAFRADWLRARGINPHSAHVLTARGDSMEPTIRDGDILLVETAIDQVADNGIYVVVYAGRTLVKRVQLRLDGSVVLRSDNQAIFDEEAVPAAELTNLKVAGRVMWYGRSI
ncbi:MAG: S24 family peptidase [Gammaproteobacteria bacterium]